MTIPKLDALRWLVAAATATMVAGCSLRPEGADDEEAKIARAGEIYAHPFERRAIPDLPPQPTWRDLLSRQFLANGDLEAAFHGWKAAMARVSMASGWPNTNLSLSFEYMFSPQRMKAWDRTTVRVAPDDRQSLSLPTKLSQAGKVALAEARSAGLRFEQLKFELQQKVLSAWLDFALMAEETRIGRDNVELLKLLVDAAEARLRAGAHQQDLLKAQLQYRMAENELATMESRLKSMAAMLNGMLARSPDAPLAPPATIPAPRPMPADDWRMIAVAVDRNKELAALAQQVQGRRDALELARMAWLPDINPMAGFRGGVEQFLGAMVTLPAAVPIIRGAIDEAGAMLQASEAMLRQGRLDRAGQVIAVLLAARDAQRQAHVLEEVILPKAQQLLAASRQAYAGGGVSFVELIDSQRTLLDARLMVARARIAREKRLAELECLTCVDLETLGGPATQPATTRSSP